MLCLMESFNQLSSSSVERLNKKGKGLDEEDWEEVCVCVCEAKKWKVTDEQVLSGRSPAAAVTADIHLTGVN